MNKKTFVFLAFIGTLLGFYLGFSAPVDAARTLVGDDRTHKGFWSNDSGNASVGISSNAAIKQFGATGENNILSSTTFTGGITQNTEIGQVNTLSSTTFSGVNVNQSESITVGVGTTTTPNTNFGVFTSTGGAIVMTATPILATTTITDGTHYTIYSATTSIGLPDNDSTSGTLLELGGGTRTLSVGDILQLIYYSGKWYETGFHNN